MSSRRSGTLTNANNQDGKASTVTPINVRNSNYTSYNFAFEDLMKDYVAAYDVAEELCDKLRAVLKAKSETYAKLIRKADLRGKRVLLAEDTEINAEIMKMILSEREMEVELAVNGREAVDMFSAHPEGYYSVILMDMRMPEMDGLTATTVIRDMDRDDARSIPIIALTANAFDEDVQRSLQSGLNAHLSKPIVPEKLFATMESLITD